MGAGNLPTGGLDDHLSHHSGLVSGQSLNVRPEPSPGTSQEREGTRTTINLSITSRRSLLVTRHAFL